MEYCYFVILDIARAYSFLSFIQEGVYGDALQMIELDLLLKKR